MMMFFWFGIPLVVWVTLSAVAYSLSYFELASSWTVILILTARMVFVFGWFAAFAIYEFVQWLRRASADERDAKLRDGAFKAVVYTFALIGFANVMAWLDKTFGPEWLWAAMAAVGTITLAVVGATWLRERMSR